MKRILIGILLSLLATSPLWLPTIWTLPWSYTVPKADTLPGLALGTFFGSLAALGIAAWNILLHTVRYKKGNVQKYWWLALLKRSLLFHLPALAMFFLGGGFLLIFAVDIFKATIEEVKELGEILVLLPALVYLFEASRIIERWESISTREERVGQNLIYLRVLAVMQSPLVLAFWLTLLWIVFWGLHQLFPALPNVWGYSIIMILLLIGLTYGFFVLLHVIEGVLVKRKLNLWRSNYWEWNQLWKD